jgi:hypothetical protein
MLCRTLASEWHCNYILCFFVYVQGSAVGRQSGCAIQCTNLEGCMQPAFFRGWFYISWMYTPEQNGSSYCQCNIMLAFNTNTSSVTHISAHWHMCLLISVSTVWCKKCGCQWRSFASVQWLNSWSKRNDPSALSVMCMHWCHWYQMLGNMKYRWTWHTYLNMSRHDTCGKYSDL